MPPNNGMHPTANQLGCHPQDAMVDAFCTRRVMPGVRPREAEEMLRKSDVYDLDVDLKTIGFSPAFSRFFHHFFVLHPRHEVGSLNFLADLTENEREIAKELIRRNLKLRYTHIIDGAWLLRDAEAVPILKEMLATEPDLSRQLVMARALWRLCREPSYIDYLKKMRDSDSATLKQAHLHQVLDLGDERTIDFLIDFLSDEDNSVRYMALLRLNEIEFGRSFLMKEPAHDSGYYQARRSDQSFISSMVEELRREELRRGAV